MKIYVHDSKVNLVSLSNPYKYVMENIHKHFVNGQSRQCSKKLNRLKKTQLYSNNEQLRKIFNGITL